MSADRGQTAVEYAVLLAVLVAALLAMQIYMKRGVSGRLREAADSIGEQYAPRNTTGNFTLTLSSKTKTESFLERGRVVDPSQGTKADVVVTKTTIESDTTNRTGQEKVGTLGTDLWN